MKFIETRGGGCIFALVLIRISAPPGNTRGPIHTEQAFAVMHGNLGRRHPLTLLIASYQGQAGLFCDLGTHYDVSLLQPLTAHYPGLTFDRMIEKKIAPRDTTISADLRLARSLFPIRRHTQFLDAESGDYVDPIALLMDAVATRDDLAGLVAIDIAPARHRRRHQAMRVIERLASPFFRSHRILAAAYLSLASSDYWWPRCLALPLGLLAGRRLREFAALELTVNAPNKHEREDDLQAASNKLDQPLFEARVRIVVSGPEQLRAESEQKLRSIASAFAPFSSARRASFSMRPRHRWTLRRPASFLLSAEELATLWHPPMRSLTTSTIERSPFLQLEPPVFLPSRLLEGESVTELGQVHFRSRDERFGLRLRDRLRHQLIIGKSGTGKSSLLLNMIQSDVTAGHGVCIIDPHGDLADTVISTVPRHRTHEVVVLDVGDRAFPISFNPLSVRSDHERPLVVSGIVSAFRKVFDLSQAPRLEHILRNTLLALLEVPGTSLVSLHRMLVDDGYRKRVALSVRDPIVRDFWLKEWAGWTARYRDEAVPAVQNKIGPFLSNPIIRNIVGQTRRTVDLRSLMDEGKVLVVNLSKGKIGDDVSALLGSFLVTKLQTAAMSRADVCEADRRPFFVYVDEFQNFATDSFATILSESRKYAMGMTLAHQYLGQVEEPTLQAVFGNVGTFLSFQVGPEDAEIVARQLSDAHVTVDPTSVMNLPQFTAYARLLIDGMPSRAFSMRTLKPAPVRSAVRADRVRQITRRRYARPIENVEAEITRALVR